VIKYGDSHIELDDKYYRRFWRRLRGHALSRRFYFILRVIGGSFRGNISHLPEKSGLSSQHNALFGPRVFITGVY
jgi:hypothetical protein